MNPWDTDILIAAVLTVLACTLPGTFLVLHGRAMLSDAVSHSVLLGIVTGFLITQNLHSPLLIVGAAFIGLLTAAASDALQATRKIATDAAIGLVFTGLFALGVLLINLYSWDVHIDAECVLFGEIAFVPFDRLIVGGETDWGPTAWWLIGGMGVLNALVIGRCFKELAGMGFDEAFMRSVGVKTGWVRQVLMFLMSLTAVVAFEYVGSILVVALMIVPGATALLWSRRLNAVMALSLFIGLITALIGYAGASWLDANIAGAMAAAAGVLFFASAVVSPRGLVAVWRRGRQRRWLLAMETLLLHLWNTEAFQAESYERTVAHLGQHLGFSESLSAQIIDFCAANGWIVLEGGRIRLTQMGREQARKSFDSRI